MKQQQLSPEKYIQTKARSLPIYKCYVTADWEEAEMANVVVMRRHVNGNCTVGFYLVDLLCLGIKDSFYFFNESEEEIEEKIDPDALYLEETDYNTAHNIVYAGHDFAMDFDIQPHKNFAVTKFILEEDDDNIPLLEIHTGDENGNPHLLVNSSYNYGPVIQKLKKNAGEGNYTFTLAEDEWVEEDNDDDDDTEDFDDWETEDNDNTLNEIEHDFIDFQILKDFTTTEILESVENETRSGKDEIIIKAELLFRRLAETEPDTVPVIEDLIETADYKLFEDTIEQNQVAAEANIVAQEFIFSAVTKLSEKDPFGEEVKEGYINLLEKNIFNELNAFMILQTIPIHIVLSCFDKLQKNFHRYLPAAQLIIAAYSVMQRKHPYTNLSFILNAQTVNQPYPSNNNIYALHHKQFWLVKGLYAIEQNDKEKIVYYHSLLSLSGIGGNIKFLYAAQLINWLANYMDVEENSVMVADEDV